MSKLRLLIVVTRPDLAGVQVHISEIINGLSDQYQITVATGSRGYLTEYAHSHAIETIIVPALVRQISPLLDARAFLELRRIIKYSMFDLVHTHSSKAGVLGRMAARSCGIPCVFTAHGWAFSDGVPLRQKLIGLVLEKVCAAITTHSVVVSQADARLGRKHGVLKTNHYSVIHNGISGLNARQHIPEVEHPTFKSVMVGRFCNQKAHASLIECYARYPDIGDLTLIGDGPTFFQIKEKIAQYGLSDRINVPGEVKNIVPHLQQSDLFILASNWEGLPISIIEALRSGLPIVATDVGGVQETVKDGRNGLLYPRGDIEKLANCIRSIKINPKLHAQMSNNSLEIFSRKFTSSRMLTSLNGVYQNAINNSG